MFWFSRLRFRTVFCVQDLKLTSHFVDASLSVALYTMNVTLVHLFLNEFYVNSLLVHMQFEFEFTSLNVFFTVSLSLLLKFHLTLDFVQPHVGCIQLHVVGCKRYLAYVIRRFSSVWVLALHSSSYPWPTTHTHKSHEDSVHLFIVHWSLELACSFPSLVQQLHCHDQ